MVLKDRFGGINYHFGNWTEWSAVWSEISCGIPKVGCSMNWIWNHKYDFRQNIIVLCSVQLHFIASILKSCIQLNSQNTRLQDFGWYQNLVNKSWKIFQTMAFCLSFPWNVKKKEKKSLEIWLVVLFWVVLHSHWPGKSCGLEQIIVWFVNKSLCWEPIRFQG